VPFARVQNALRSFFSCVFSFFPPFFQQFIFDCDAHARAQRARYLPACHHLDQILGIYYCANWTTPGNCHDMSLLSGIVAAHAIGAAYPFPDAAQAKKDFYRLRSLMGL